MAVLSDHHWRNPIAGLRELTRVARRVVVFQWHDREIPRFWLVRDYLPEFAGLATGQPGLAARAAAIGAEQRRVPIPRDSGGVPRRISVSRCGAGPRSGLVSGRWSSAAPWTR
jgi:hypothetical protein